MPTEAKINGLETLKKNLASIMSAVETRVLIETVTLGAQVIQGSMSLRAPTDTGQLRGDIEIELIPKVRRGQVTAKIGPGKESFYGKFLEFGTKRMAAQPFMRPAVDEDGPRAIQIMNEHVRRVFETGQGLNLIPVQKS